MKEQVENIGFIVKLAQQAPLNPTIAVRYLDMPADYLNFLEGWTIMHTKMNAMNVGGKKNAIK